MYLLSNSPKSLTQKCLKSPRRFLDHHGQLHLVPRIDEQGLYNKICNRMCAQLLNASTEVGGVECVEDPSGAASEDTLKEMRPNGVPKKSLDPGIALGVFGIDPLYLKRNTCSQR